MLVLELILIFWRMQEFPLEIEKAVSGVPLDSKSSPNVQELPKESKCVFIAIFKFKRHVS